jgi:predicted ATPase
MLATLKIQNFRKFERYEVEFDDRTLLVGPNNAGKSTLIEALRLVSIVVNRVRALNFEYSPDWLGDRDALRGVMPSLRGFDFALGPETFHNYADPPAVITASFSSGSSVTVYIGPDADVFAVVRDVDGSLVMTKRHAREVAFERIGIQPQVGPLARIERPLADRYVRGALDSSLAPIHFRNQLRLLSDYYDDFKAAAESSWPGLVIDGLEALGVGEDRRIALFVRDGEFVGEVAAMGHGLQMWLQLMWFLARSASDGAVVLDEPDVYMHPDLQRRLLRFVLARRQQVIVATHSVEMMAEVEPDDLVVIDAGSRTGRRARTSGDVQRVIEQIGGVHNIEFARLAHAETCLIAPAADTRLLRRWYDLVVRTTGDAIDVLPTLPFEGWGSWPFVVAAKRIIDSVRQEPIRALCFLPSAAMPPTFIEARLAEALDAKIYLWVWRRRELANYLIDPYVIARTIGRRSDGATVEATAVALQVERIIESLRIQVSDGLVASWAVLADSTESRAREFIEERWDTIEGRLSLVPGRLALLRLSAWSRDHYGVTLGLQDLAGEFTSADLHPDVTAALAAVTEHSPSFAVDGPPSRPWPTIPRSAVSGVEAAESDIDAILSLLQESGALAPD